MLGCFCCCTCCIACLRTSLANWASSSRGTFSLLTFSIIFLTGALLPCNFPRISLAFSMGSFKLSAFLVSLGVVGTMVSAEGGTAADWPLGSRRALKSIFSLGANTLFSRTISGGGDFANGADAAAGGGAFACARTGDDPARGGEGVDLGGVDSCCLFCCCGGLMLPHVARCLGNWLTRLSNSAGLERNDKSALAIVKPPDAAPERSPLISVLGAVVVVSVGCRCTWDCADLFIILFLISALICDDGSVAVAGLLFPTDFEAVVGLKNAY